MDICYLSVMDVRDVELGRLTALRKVIYEYPRIEEEFIEYVDYGINDMSFDEINTVIHEFAKEYGIKILRENPYVRFDEEKQCYRVDVSYKIDMNHKDQES